MGAFLPQVLGQLSLDARNRKVQILFLRNPGRKNSFSKDTPVNIISWASSRVSRGSKSGKVLSLQKIYEGFKRTFLENLEVLKTLQGGIFQEKYKVYQDFNIFLSNWKGLFLLEKFSEG